MAAGFDPYHRWLSIPPAEQPANHYRLLGVAAYEANVEVIQNAAERQSRHVRSHLRSPLGAYAINLIREIEVARLCLIDGESKSAYDACLIQRAEYDSPIVSQPAASQLAGWPDNARVHPASAPADQFSSPAEVVPSIVANRYRLKKRKSAPVYFVFMWLASGAIGLLGGYAVLCMIDPQYDFLHVMFREDQSDAKRAERAAVPPVIAETAESQRRTQPVAKSEKRPRPVASSQVDSNNTDELAPHSMAPGQNESPPELGELNEPNANEKENQQAGNDLKPVILPFDLKKRVLRVVSIPDERPQESLFCNVSGSPELALPPLTDFPLGGKRDLMFNLRMSGSIVGVEVSFLKRSMQVVVDIRPKYRLPSGDEVALYKLAGVKKEKLLTNRVLEAIDAERSLPSLRSRLSSAIRDYNAVLPMANTPTSAGRSLSQAAAQRRAANFFDQGAALESQIREAESLSAGLSRLQTDLTAIRELGEWGAKIAETANLSVSIHNNGVGLVAEAK